MIPILPKPKGAASGARSSAIGSASKTASKKGTSAYGTRIADAGITASKPASFGKVGVSGIAPKFTPTQPIIPARPTFPAHPVISPDLLSKTITQLAEAAITLLEKAKENVVKEAIQTIKAKTSAARLMDYLERKVKVGEVLNELAEEWDDETIQDFASAFQMESNKSEVMDSIVSIAILNDPELEDEIRMENTPDVEESNLLENRRIVWQHPDPGTPLEPPYIILVAVEHEDVVEIEEMVQSIIGSLDDYENFKLPTKVVQRMGSLGDRGRVKLSGPVTEYGRKGMTK